jgi:hypothetical protein
MKAIERQYLGKVASLGCMICKMPAEIHHIRTGQGHMRAKYTQVIPLCHRHHRTGGYGVAIHAGIKAWEEMFGTELDMLEKVIRLIGD